MPPETPALQEGETLKFSRLTVSFGRLTPVSEILLLYLIPYSDIWYLTQISDILLRYLTTHFRISL